MGYKQVFGRWGEQKAAAYLTGQGLEIVACNWRCIYGEIDIIARKESQTIFVEVKTRKNDQFGLPENAITPQKKEHLVRSAMEYIDRYAITGPWQIDIVSIQKLAGGHYEIEWFENAITEND